MLSFGYLKFHFLIYQLKTWHITHLWRTAGDFTSKSWQTDGDDKLKEGEYQQHTTDSPEESLRENSTLAQIIMTK